MTPTDICVEYRRFLRACAGGLSEPTALVELSVRDDLVWDAAAESRIRNRAASLCPGEIFYGVAESDWPTAFLVGTEDCGDGLRRLGSWVVALTVAIQRWGRDPVWRGQVLDVGDGRLELAIPWYREDHFDRALQLALQVVSDPFRSERRTDGQSRWLNWLKPHGDAEAGPTLDDYLGADRAGILAGGMAPNTLRFIEAAVRRGMPFDVLPSFVQIGWGANAKRFDLATSGQTSWIAQTTAKNKVKTIQALAGAGIPVPRARLVGDIDEARRAAEQLGWPVVVKPFNQDGGNGVTLGIAEQDRVVRAFNRANQFSPGAVLVEGHVRGDDYRFLVVCGRVLQVARRRAAQVVGDGHRTVGQLVARLNDDPRRGTQRYSLLKVVAVDDDVLDCLATQGLTPESVPPVGVAVPLSLTANISAGGTAEDVTGSVHPDNIALAARTARIIGLDIAGVDFLCPDIGRSWREVGGVVCEVNAQPGFRPHWLADPGRDINGEVLDILFGGRPARVPTAAITGTNGKTTTSEMLHRIWTTAGKLTGVCTTARVRIGEETVSTENLSGQPGSRLILNDPGVEAAVLEMPRKGLIMFGHHCDRYDVAALLNVQDDHIGVDGIETLEQMAELKAQVLERASRAIVVNAEDPLCLAMRARAATRRHILIARSPRVDALAEHRRQGGEAVFIDDRGDRPWIVLAAGPDESELMPVHDVPAAMNGLLPFNEINALFAAGLAWAQGIDEPTIRRALSSFTNSRDQNPGRYNFVGGLPFSVLVDFAHNPEGVRGICSVIASLPVKGRRLLCS
nr:Mur ligase family protein [Mycobacterium sp.]